MELRPPARDNAWVASQLRELAARLDLDDGSYRSRAYRRAAETVEFARPIASLRAEDGKRRLEALPGIGPHIAAIICELVDTGKARVLEQLRSNAPVDVMKLLAVDGIGPKTLKILWEQLQVRTLDDLERALRDDRLLALRGFGPRRCERLQTALRIQRRGNQRVARKKAIAIARRLVEVLSKDPHVVECAVAGSLRRGLATVGDIDLVAATDDPKVVAALFLERPEIESVYSRGPHRVSVRLTSGVDVDLRTVPPESFGSALLYFTGSRAHSVALRRLALAEGLRLNEYGLFRGRERIAGQTEHEIYEALSLPYFLPEDRRGTAEIRDALRKKAMTKT